MSYPPQRRRVVAAAPRRQPAELRSVRVVFEPDSEQGYMRAHAEAEVVIEGVEQTLTSGGMWGIEDDAEDEYLDEIIDGEWSALRTVLKTVGVSTEQLPLTVEREWIEWRTTDA